MRYALFLLPVLVGCASPPPAELAGSRPDSAGRDGRNADGAAEALGAGDHRPPGENEADPGWRGRPPPAEDPARRRVSFAFREVPFRMAVTRLSRLAGVRIDWESDLPARALDTPVTLTVDGMPLERACAWLGRLAGLQPLPFPEGAGLRFTDPDRADPARGPWALTRVDVGRLVTPPPPPPLALRRVGSYDRLMGRGLLPLPVAEPPEPGMEAKRIPVAGRSGPAVLEDLDLALKENREAQARSRREAAESLLAFLKPFATVSYEHPKPCRFLPGSERQLLIDQPARGRPWLLEVLNGLESLAPPTGLSGPEQAEEEEASERWDAPVALPRGDARGETETGDAILFLARQAGVNVGWDPRECSGAVLRRVGLPGGRLPFREALGILARRAGFLRILREPGAGAWLLGPREASLPARGRWEAWMTLGVYPIPDLDERLGAETVQGLLRSRLPGDPWQEPGALMAYHPGTGRLVVRHRPELQLDVQALLAGLRQTAQAPGLSGR